jgi:hypothetical protein
MYVTQDVEDIKEFESFKKFNGPQSYIIARIYCNSAQLSDYLKGLKRIDEHNYLASDDEILRVLIEKHKELGQVISSIRDCIMETGMTLDEIFWKVKRHRSAPLSEVGMFMKSLRGERLTSKEIYKRYLQEIPAPHLPWKSFGMQLVAHGFKAKLSTRGGVTGRYYDC